MKDLVEQILAKKYHLAESTLTDALLKRAVDSIEEKKVSAGKLFFESTETNELDEDVIEEDYDRPVKKREVVNTYVHSTSGKEVRATRSPGKDWDEKEYGVDTERELAAGKSKKKQKAYGLREEENLQELSSKLLTRYRTKSLDDYKKASKKVSKIGNKLSISARLGDKIDPKDVESYNSNKDKADRRIAGNRLAGSKINRTYPTKTKGSLKKRTDNARVLATH